MVTDLQYYLSNDVYRAVKRAERGQWSRQETRVNPPPIKSTGGGGFGIPGNPGHTVHAEWAPGISEADVNLGIMRPFAIMVERELYDSVSYEVGERAWDDWLEALEEDAARRTLWILKRAGGKTYWYPNEPLKQAPRVGLLITNRLLESGLIWRATEDQHAMYRAARADLAGDRRTPADIIYAGMLAGAA